MIAGAEILLGITYPQAYRNLILEFGGAYGDAEFSLDQPSPGFDYCSISIIHSLNPCSQSSIYALMATWPEHELDAAIIPFGEDGGGNYICFDYRNRSENPAIVFYFHELSGTDSLMKVCESLESSGN
ncbi:MAG: SMI1/KNR4 family protein [Cyanothece sp. SIO2G6]|nr:SMI1/KNR4 family protein [Cyanothece sp. SIO2G6]